MQAIGKDFKISTWIKLMLAVVFVFSVFIITGRTTKEAQGNTALGSSDNVFILTLLQRF